MEETTKPTTKPIDTDEYVEISTQQYAIPSTLTRTLTPAYGRLNLDTTYALGPSVNLNKDTAHANYAVLIKSDNTTNNNSDTTNNNASITNTYNNNTNTTNNNSNNNTTTTNNNNTTTNTNTAYNNSNIINPNPNIYTTTINNSKNNNYNTTTTTTTATINNNSKNNNNNNNNKAVTNDEIDDGVYSAMQYQQLHHQNRRDPSLEYDTLDRQRNTSPHTTTGHGSSNQYEVADDHGNLAKTQQQRRRQQQPQQQQQHRHQQKQQHHQQQQQQQQHQQQQQQQHGYTQASVPHIKNHLDNSHNVHEQPLPAVTYVLHNIGRDGSGQHDTNNINDDDDEGSASNNNQSGV